MNRFALLAAITVALTFGFAAPALAQGPCDGPNPPFFCGPQDPPTPDPQGAPGGSNTNTNTNTANGGGAEVGNGFGNFSPTSFAGGGDGGAGGDADANAGALAGAGVFGSGNSSSNSRSGVDFGEAEFGGDGGNARQGQGQMQGQVGIQGQLGILDSDNDLDNSNNTNTSTSTSTSTNSKNKQGQDQTAVGSVDSHDSVTVEGDDVVYEAPDIPVNSAAPVFAGACSQGVSVQTQSFGGSAGTTNPVCDYVAVAGGFIAAGDRDDALRVLEKAEDAADWRYRFSQIRSVLTLGLL